MPRALLLLAVATALARLVHLLLARPRPVPLSVLAPTLLGCCPLLALLLDLASKYKYPTYFVTNALSGQLRGGTLWL